MSDRRLGITAALILAAVCAGPVAAASGGIGLRLLDAPAAAQRDPRARIFIVDHLAPGAVIHRRVEISNTTVAPIHVALYPAAAAVAAGSFVGAAGHTRNELSTWTAVAPRTSAVPAGERTTAVVTVAVPHDAAPGERYGVVWAEARSAPRSGAGITQVSRVGIRLYVSIGPGGAPAADFTIGALTAKRSADGRPMVLASVHNTGGRALDINGTLRLLAGPGGLSAGPFRANLGVTLGIGDTEPVTILLDRRLPAGPWHARVTMHSGLITRTKRAVVGFPATKASSSPHLVAIVLGLLLVLLVTTVLLLRRRGHGRRPDRRAQGAPRRSRDPALRIKATGSRTG